MPLYRCTTIKKSTLNTEFNNRYYFEFGSTSERDSKLADLVSLEQQIFGSTVDFLRVHWKQVGVPAFGNLLFNVSGLIPAATPVKSFIVAKVFFATEDSYPYYKDYRVQVTTSSMSGKDWALSYQSVLNDFATDFSGTFALNHRTRTGAALGVASPSPEYWNDQESNAWYNRKPPGA
jgi:hypothetical protein